MTPYHKSKRVWDSPKELMVFPEIGDIIHIEYDIIAIPTKSYCGVCPLLRTGLCHKFACSDVSYVKYDSTFGKMWE